MSLFHVCPKCATQTHSLHAEGCEIEQCANCGGYRGTCYCDNDDIPRLVFDGELPGARAARRFGWFTRYTELGWERCYASDEGAAEDFQRIQFEAWWNPERAEWTKLRTDM